MSLPAQAGEFTISPIRIYMNPTDRAIAVTITNESDEPLVMQADLYAWSQNEAGEEVLELSEDIFMSPPIISLEPRARQVVRLARLTNATPPEQLTYRLIAREIPVDPPEVAGGQVQMALALSLPIFITPRNAKNELDCSFERADPAAARVVCENYGNAYAQPREITLSGADGLAVAKIDGAKYILPGAKVSFDLPAETVIPAGQGRLDVTMDDNAKHVFDVSIPE
jgi:fimbrial chaperone protein